MVSGVLERTTVFEAIFQAVVQVKASRGIRYELPKTPDPSIRLDALGIDSISIAEVVDVLEQRFKVELPFSDLMLVESVEQFIDIICVPRGPLE
jgi:acyl carrier protein